MFQDNNPIYEFRGPWGVPVQIGGSIFLFPLLFIGLNFDPTYILYDATFVVLIVGSIFLHELGHAWGCIIQGVPVRRIMLHGGGGFCEPARSSSRYEQELIVAMGPIVNLTLWATASLIEPFVSNYWLADTLFMLAYINFFLAILNLLPVMPLDGGRLFALGLARILHPTLATRVAGAVGLVIAVLWLPLMALSYFSLGLVLFFIPPIGLHWEMLRRAT